MAELIGSLFRRGCLYFQLVLLLLLFICLSVDGNVVLVGRNFTISFDDAESAFGPEIEEPGVRGILYVASPLDACSPLTNHISKNESISKFALIMRGGCTFYDKVLNAQNAGFKVSIIYDDSYHNRLVTMAGEDNDITIPSTFISRESGESLLSLSLSLSSFSILITPSPSLPTWSLTTITLISFLAISSIIFTCCFIKRRRRRQVEILPRVRREVEGGMGWDLVRKMEVVEFEEREGERGESCVVCLEDYGKGDKLRILPCRHRFHMNCIDSWLTKWRTFCPICKHDARNDSQNPPPTETTPLLSLLNFPPNPSLAHFLRFSNYLSFANRTSLAQILRLGPSNSANFWFSSGSSNGPSG